MAEGAIIVGAGPNGLAAAVTLARAGVPVEVYERASFVGGGTRTAEITLPGFRHDICSAVHPMALVSPFFREFRLTERIQFLNPDIAYAQGITRYRAAIAWRDVERTAAGLGRDGAAWLSLMRPFIDHADRVTDLISRPLLRVPARPWEVLGLGLTVLEQGTPLWNLRWREQDAPALLGGALAHAIGQLPSLSAAAAGLVLAGAAHVGGWPIPMGGSQSIADALADDARAHGATFTTGVEVSSLADLPPARAVIFDTTPRAMVRIAGVRLPAGHARRLLRFRYGDGVAKVDYALSGPVPWAAPGLAGAGTIHLGGTREETAASEAAVARGEYPERPYVLVSQPSVLDP
ncbi:MAG: phytoene desaturase family protein, partial [Actinomycetota bacterium]